MDVQIGGQRNLLCWSCENQSHHKYRCCQWFCLWVYPGNRWEKPQEVHGEQIKDHQHLGTALGWPGLKSCFGWVGAVSAGPVGLYYVLIHRLLWAFLLYFFLPAEMGTHTEPLGFVCGVIMPGLVRLDLMIIFLPLRSNINAGTGCLTYSSYK